ncbi:MAG: HEAT repeat domain-containing protein [Candidatus Riflebacteria bacterium]|nr:HEAT repeat domain-containing protein [Candidatus Riflebacteria bacterium]
MKKYIFIFLTVLMLIAGCEITPEDRLAKGLKDKNPEVRIETANQLAEVGSAKALQLLQLHEDDEDFRARDAIKAAIQKIQKQIFFK